MFKALLLLMLALIAFPAFAQEEPTSGSINGRVVNDRGEAMAGATVMLRPVGSFTPGRQATSDAEGNFRFSGLEPALYTVSGFAPAYVLLPPDPDSTPPFYRLGDSVRLDLVKGGVITGTVTNVAGEPVVGVRVRAFRIRDAKGQGPRAVQFGFVERTTDDRGIYRIYGLSPGTYLVNAGGGSGQSFQFNPFETDVPVYSPASTRDTATEFVVRSGEETTADIRYRSDPGHTISGAVKLSGSNQGAAISVVSSDGNNVPVANPYQAPGARGFAVSGLGDGEYTVYAQAMVPAFESVTTIPDIAMSDARRITIKGADVTGIELVTKPLAVIGGVVALEPSKAPECQGKRKPAFSEMLIEMHRHEKDAESLAPYARASSGIVTPNDKGAFTQRNVMPARYRFNARFYARYWYLQSISLGTPATTATTNAKSPAPASKNDAAATWTTLKSGDQVSNLMITLAEGAASIRGKIAVAEGATIPSGASIYLMPAEREKVDDVLRYFVTQVTPDGAFTLNNLPPGRYWILVQNPGPAEASTLLKLRSPESLEARTTLRRAAETQKADLELKPCQTLADYKLSFK
jgi:carboxypeptidase family protein